MQEAELRFLGNFLIFVKKSQNKNISVKFKNVKRKNNHSKNKHVNYQIRTNRKVDF